MGVGDAGGITGARRAGFLIGLGLGVTGLAVPAAAEDPPGRGQADPTIIVTAQFRPQDEVEVPMALTAFAGDFVERIGVEDFEELARFVPGFEVQNQSVSNPGFVIRGITSDSGVSFNEPRVSVFQDGVSTSKVRGSFVELFDLERVEIARGPQTTLYGRSAMIGAVNVIQNKADPSQRAIALRGEAGNLGYLLSEGVLNLPLSESAAVRFAGRYRLRDGTIEDLLGGRDLASVASGAVRGSLRLLPAQRLTFDLIGNYQHDQPTGTPFISLTRRQTDPATGAVLAPLDPRRSVALSSAPTLAGGRPLGFDREVEGVTGLAEYRSTPALTLNAVTAWRHFNSLEILDADGIALPILAAADRGDGRQVSHELRLRFDDEGPLAGFVGASYFHERGFQRVDTVFDERLLLAQLTGSLNGRLPERPQSDPAPLAVLRNTALTAQLLQALAGANGVVLPSSNAAAVAANLKTDHQEAQTNFSETKAWDVFADMTVRPLDRLELSGGLRYSHERKRSGIAAEVVNGRSILGGAFAALQQPAPIRNALLGALGLPGAATLPASPALPLFGLAGQPTTGNGQRIDARLSDGGLTYRAVARFAPSPASSVYVSYARGRRPKVLAVRTPTVPAGVPDFQTLRAETVDSFELGAKARLPDRGLFLAGSVFHYRYRNFQTTEQAGAVFVVTNAGRARSTGVEGEFRWHASDAIDLFGSYAYNHSRFRSGIRRGNRLRLAPDHSFALGAVARAPVGSGDLTFTPTVTFQSKTFFDSENDRPELQQRPEAAVPDNVQDEFQPAFALVNARVGYAPAKAPWRVEAFVENLLDKGYFRDAGNIGDAFGLPTAVPGTPRTYGISLRVGFAE